MIILCIYFIVSSKYIVISFLLQSTRALPRPGARAAIGASRSASSCAWTARRGTSSAYSAPCAAGHSTTRATSKTRSSTARWTTNSKVHTHLFPRSLYAYLR